jgi:hypothetical protein
MFSVIGFGRTASFPLSALLFGACGALAAGALKGLKQAVEAEEVEQIAAFE